MQNDPNGPAGEAAAASTRSATNADWFKIATDMEDALRHIGTLADCAFAIVTDAELVSGIPEKRWSIPDYALKEASAFLFAIRATAAHAQGVGQ